MKLGEIVSILVLAVVSAFVMAPILWMLSMSIRPDSEMFRIPPAVFPEHITLDSYLSAFSTVIGGASVQQMFVNSFVVAIGATALILFVSSFAGYGFSRLSFRGKNLLLLYVGISQMFPPIVMIIPYFRMAKMAGLYNTYLMLILADAVSVLPLCTWIFLSFLESIPTSIDEAALIDGCSRLQAFYKIIFSLSWPGLISIIMWAFVFCWNDYMYALTLTQTADMRVVTVGITGLIGQFHIFYSKMLSISFLASVPPLILFTFLQRYLMSGMISGWGKA